MRLKGKTAIVTGATSGIGKAIALSFAREGASVCVVGRDPDRLESVVREIGTSGIPALPVNADLTRLSDIDRIVSNAMAAFGRLDILVNSAGIFRIADFFAMTESDYETMMSSNLKGAFFLSQRAAGEMRKTGGGKIINIASQAGGVVGFPRGSVYCASKGALVSLTKALAIELAPYRINVNAVSPGTVRTPINEKLFVEHPDFLSAEISSTPWGRLGETADICPAVVYLASAESDFVTGIQLVIDGGFSAQ